jgi:hypothetical protein
MVKAEKTTPKEMYHSIFWYIMNRLTIRDDEIILDYEQIKTYQKISKELVSDFVDLYLMNTPPDSDFKNYNFWLSVKNLTNN